MAVNFPTRFKSATLDHLPSSFIWRRPTGQSDRYKSLNQGITFSVLSCLISGALLIAILSYWLVNLLIIQYKQNVSLDFTHASVEQLNKSFNRLQHQQMLMQQNIQATPNTDLSNRNINLFDISQNRLLYQTELNQINQLTVFGFVEDKTSWQNQRLEAAINLVTRYRDFMTANSLNLYIYANHEFSVFSWPGIQLSSAEQVSRLMRTKFIENDASAAKNNQSQWSAIYTDTVTKEAIVSLRTPIYIDNRYWFTIAQDFSVKQLELMHLSSSSRYANYHLVAAELNHDHVYQNDLIDAKYHFSMQDMNRLIAQAQDSSNQSKVEISVQSDKHDAFIAALPLNSLPLWLVCITPYASYNTLSFSLLIFLGLLIVSFATSLFLYLSLKRRVYQPVRIFTQVCEQVKRGDYHLAQNPILEKISQQKNEMGLMAQSCISMGKTIQHNLESLEDEITQRTLTLDQALQEQKAIFNNAYIGILLIKGSNVTNCNKRFEEITGYKVSEIIHQKQTFLSLDGKDILADLRWLREKLFDQGSFMLDCECKHKNGNLFWCSAQFKALDSKDVSKGIVLTLVDITKRRNAELLLAREARVDGLTGIGNRRAFDEAILLSCRRAQREAVQITLAMIDVDLFKKFNDEYGHVVGDEALIQVAKQLQKVARRPYELAARYGGEEFALIIHGDMNIQEMLDNLANNIRALNIEHKQSPHHYLTVSIGAVSVTTQIHTKLSSQWLIEYTDRLLYQAKKSGRNQVQLKSLNLSEAIAAEDKID